MKNVERLLTLLEEDERGSLTRGTPEFSPPMSGKDARRAFSDEAWLFERKLDGIRCLAVRTGGETHLYDRRGELLDRVFPEILQALDKLPPDTVVDGEIAAFDGKKNSLALLEPHLQAARFQVSQAQFGDQPEEAGQALANAENSSGGREPKLAPCWFYLFDLLQLGAYDLRNLPLASRKTLLRNLIRYSRPLRFTDHRRGDGEHLFEIACRKGWEGVVAKRADGHYRSGRVGDWLGISCKQKQELVIGGYTSPNGSRDAFGELLMGFFDGQKLRYAGKVGTGFDYQALGGLKQMLDQHRQHQCPFADPIHEQNCHWLTPELVCEVAFTTWTRDLKLRQPRYLRLRRDVNAREIVKSEASPVEAA